MEKFVTQGLVRSLGVSNFNSTQLRRLYSKVDIKPVCNQVCHTPTHIGLLLETWFIHWLKVYVMWMVLAVDFAEALHYHPIVQWMLSLRQQLSSHPKLMFCVTTSISLMRWKQNFETIVTLETWQIDIVNGTGITSLVMIVHCNMMNMFIAMYCFAP